MYTYADIDKYYNSTSAVALKNLDEPFVIHTATGDIVVDANQKKLLPDNYENAFLVKKSTVALVQKNEKWQFINLKSGEIEFESDMDAWLGETWHKK